MLLDKSSSIMRSMAESNEELTFNTAFCSRVKELREAKNWTAEQMAIALGIPSERYRKYEVRSPLPQYLLPRFAAIVDRSIEYIVTGMEVKSQTVRHPVKKRMRA